MKTIVGAIYFFLVFALNVSSAFGFEAVATVKGVAKVKDGDGILFGSVEIRLQGIAAPEYRRNKKETGGFESMNALKRLADDKTLDCHLDGTTASSGRPVGVCFVHGVELNAWMVRNGHARDCPRFSDGRYKELETAAKFEGRNLAAAYRLPEYCSPQEKPK